MYISYFGLKQSPFRTAPDPDYFFASGLHLRAVDRVVHAIRERAGLILVMGEIGQGKTTVCRYVQTRYREEFFIGYLGNPFLDVQEFGRQILLEFGLCGDVTGSGDIVRVLTGFLREQDRQGKVVVLFLDEAHLLSPDVLEFLLIVTNIQHHGRHLLQMVLAGQNEFQETLRQPRFSSLNQRLGNRIVVADLGRDDLADYIRFRLDQAGGSGKELFTPGAVSKIWKVTRGNPRLINLVCERLLERMYERRVDKVLSRDVTLLCKNPVFVPILFPDTNNAGAKLWGPVLVGTVLTFGLVVGAGTLGHDHPPGVVDIPEFAVPRKNPANPTVVVDEPVVLETREKNEPIGIVGAANKTSIDGTVPPRKPLPTNASGSNASTVVETATIALSESAGNQGNGTRTKVEEKLEKILELLATREAGSGAADAHEKSESPAEIPPDTPDATTAFQPEQGAQIKPVHKRRAKKTAAAKKQAETAPAVQPEKSQPAANESTGQESATGDFVLSPAPGIVVDAIVWDPIPRFRLAVVNERIVKQGASVGDGYTVEVILKDSIRLSMGGRMFENRVHGGR
ncbi:ExeA family protein [Desulfoplanes sp.]